MVILCWALVPDYTLASILQPLSNGTTYKSISSEGNVAKIGTSKGAAIGMSC